MRIGVVALASALVVVLTAVARADHEPAFVVPGRPDVPVMINGYDASWGVVEGDWGLYRPGQGTVTVIPSPYARPRASAPPYYPSFGGKPYVGRYEVEPSPDRRLPPPAQHFHRSWSSASDPAAAVTEYAPSPPIIAAPSIEERRQRQRHRNR